MRTAQRGRDNGRRRGNGFPTGLPVDISVKWTDSGFERVSMKKTGGAALSEERSGHEI